jgi:hypothetical protein
MGHKVHPKSFRIKGVADWNVRGFYGRNMPQYLEEDLVIKSFLNEILLKLQFQTLKLNTPQ